MPIERTLHDAVGTLLERLALSKDSVESLARMVQSQLDLSIAGLLGE